MHNVAKEFRKAAFIVGAMSMFSSCSKETVEPQKPIETKPKTETRYYDMVEFNSFGSNLTWIAFSAKDASENFTYLNEGDSKTIVKFTGAGKVLTDDEQSIGSGPDVKRYAADANDTFQSTDAEGNIINWKAREASFIDFVHGTGNATYDNRTAKTIVNEQAVKLSSSKFELRRSK